MLSPLVATCMSHNYGNLTKRAIQKHLDKFLEFGVLKFEQLIAFVQYANQVLRSDLQGEEKCLNEYLCDQIGTKLKTSSEVRFQYIEILTDQVMKCKDIIEELQNSQHPKHNLVKEAQIDFVFTEALDKAMKFFVPIFAFVEQAKVPTMADILPLYEYIIVWAADLDLENSSPLANHLRAIK